jgi:hypothetical protein
VLHVTAEFIVLFVALFCATAISVATPNAIVTLCQSIVHIIVEYNASALAKLTKHERCEERKRRYSCCYRCGCCYWR